MPLYYLHLRDGEDILLDREGSELAGPDALASAALKEARALISHDAGHGRINLSYHLDIEDSSGTIVHRLYFEDAVEIVRGPQRA